MRTIAFVIIFSFAIGAIALSWFYFRHFRLNRPPIGVINLYDIALLIGGIIVVPILYLWLPGWLVMGLLALGAWSLLTLLFEPMIPVRLAVWGLSAALLVGDITAARLWTTQSRPFLFLNNLVMLLIIIGIANLWAQSGMKARDAALLAGALIFYDFVATGLLPLMGDLFERMMRLPLATQLAWPGDVGLAAIGVGDVLMAAVFPLVMRRAFGLTAGVIAVVCAVGVLVVLPLLPMTSIFPVMVILGPVMVVQYLYWRGKHGPERPTWQYFQAEA